MASVSNHSVPTKSVFVDLGAEEPVLFSYSDEDTVRTFNERIAVHTGFSADEQELYVHYNRKWCFCCEVMEELDDPNARFKDVLNEVSYISLKVFIDISRACNCQTRDLP